MEILEVLKEQLYGLAAVLPVLLKAGVLLLLGVVLAKILRQAVSKLIAVIGLDSLADKINDVELVQKSGYELKLSKFLGALVYYFTLLVFIMAAVEALGMQMISDLMADFINYIPQAFTAFVVLLLGLFFADFIKKIVYGACRSLNIASGALISSVIFYFIFLNILLISLQQAKLQTNFMENNITVILAGVALAFAIGYGLASKDAMANLLAAYYNKGRLEIGDEISVEGLRGEIIEMNNTAITLRSADTDVIVPFHKLSSKGLIIYSRRNKPNALPPNIS